MIGRCIVAFTLALFTLPVSAGEIAGKARSIDGDSLEIDGTRIDLFGVDAPELKQTCTSRKKKIKHCGDLSRQMLGSLLKNVTIKCRRQAPDREGAIVATCFAGPFDINEQMVSSGWAFPVLQETDAYVRAETFAKARNEGMWRGNFTLPWVWRKEQGE
jgi:endonuclease YncB( thermonuclease family)